MKNAILLSLLFTLFVMPSCGYGAENKPYRENVLYRPSAADWSTILSTYLPPLVLSGFVGAGTGYFAQYLKRELKLSSKTDEGMVGILALFIAEHLVRTKIIAGMQEDFEACRILYKRNMMYLVAWIASWVAYSKA